VLVDVLGTLGVLMVVSIPLGLSCWALLDAARRPSWVWAFAERRRLVWLTLIFAGTFTLAAGVVISGYYLLRIRRHLAAIEAGKLE
jgi:uncharacterized membrane protein